MATQDNAPLFNGLLPGHLTPPGNLGGATKVGRVDVDAELTIRLAGSKRP
ncbi:hypothetical protein ACFFHJ_20200 [Planotetraspora thailandica]|nr:hypothetical protein [Planotetraspora thailandica]